MQTLGAYRVILCRRSAMDSVMQITDGRRMTCDEECADAPLPSEEDPRLMARPGVFICGGSLVEAHCVARIQRPGILRGSTHLRSASESALTRSAPRYLNRRIHLGDPALRRLPENVHAHREPARDEYPPQRKRIRAM